MDEQNFKWSRNTPVLVIVFNRPEKTRTLLRALEKAKPMRIYVAADGPRNPEEAPVCREVRELFSNLSWNPEIEILARERNLGCKAAVSGAITWFFSKVESGIILEDDCIPRPSFFGYCEELLERYAADERIMQIAGTNLGLDPDIRESYFFSQMIHIWGWATWRRAWAHYDLDMKTFPEFIATKSYQKWISPDFRVYPFLKELHATWAGQKNTWDYQWLYCCVSRGGLSINPARNLIQNIGFDSSGTHTLDSNDRLSAMRTHDIELPLVHPSRVERNVVLDLELVRKFHYPGVLGNLKRFLATAITRPLRAHPWSCGREGRGSN